MSQQIEPSKQVIANRENGMKGGVKTPRGKEVSSQNAKVHGILSLRVFQDEQEEYMDLYNAINSELNPTNIMEKVLAERLAFHIIQMQRVSFSTNEFLLQCCNKGKSIDRTFDALQSLLSVEVIEEAYAPQISPDDVEQLLSLYHRYEVAVENRFYKAVREISQLRRIL